MFLAPFLAAALAVGSTATAPDPRLVLLEAMSREG